MLENYLSLPFFSETTSQGQINLTYLDENNIVQTFSATASTSASASEKN